MSGLNDFKTDLSRTILDRLDEAFRNSILILDVEDDQMTSSGLDEVFRMKPLELQF